MSEKRKSILKPVLVVVEGLDYLHLIRNRIKDSPEFDSVQLWDFADGTDLGNNLRLLRGERNFATVTALGIIKDAEASRPRTDQSVRDILRANGFGVPNGPLAAEPGLPKTAYLVVPHNMPSGCLEHACLDAAANVQQLPCVDAFYNCVSAHHPQPLNANHIAKLKVHAHIAGSGYNPAMTLGQSAETAVDIWNFDHPSLQALFTLIRVLLQ